MNVTLYAREEATALRPGAIILDVPEHDSSYPAIDKLPNAYVVDEISDRLDGRTVYGRPLHRTDGKRRVWRFKTGEQVKIEPDPHTAAVLLSQLRVRAEASDCVLVVGPGARSLDAIQEAADVEVEEVPADG